MLRFDMVEDSRTRDHWILISTGNLQIRDRVGLISSAKKIE